MGTERHLNLISTPSSQAFPSLTAAVPVHQNPSGARRANSFNYYKQVTGTDPKPVKVQNTPGTQLVIDSLPVGATVQITVAGVNDAGEGQPSPAIPVVVT